MLTDPTATTELGALAAAIRGADADDLQREHASIVARVQLALKRIRKMRNARMEAPAGASSVAQLSRLERYQDRARAQTKYAVIISVPLRATN